MGWIALRSQRNDNIRLRATELGLALGRLRPGPKNSITDVGGVRVGHCTLIEGEGTLEPGRGPVRTGVTAVLPHGDNLFTEKVSAAVHEINGFGKPIGLSQVKECGVLETPILLTNTLNVGLVADALIDYMLKLNPAIGVSTGTVNPVVLECNDGDLNDIRGRHVKKEHVFSALERTSDGPVPEGAVGAGTGMTAFGWKGGIGTASRLVPAPDGGEYVLGALVLSNFGTPEDLVVGGWPVGRYLRPPNADEQRGEELNPSDGSGSVVIVLATDAPVDARQLRRIAARAVVGIVRCGSRLQHGSGDYVVAFSTGFRVPHGQAHAYVAPGAAWSDDSPVIANLLLAGGEATEEAVLNSMLQAHTLVGRDGNVRYALPVDELTALLRRFDPTIRSTV